MTQEYSPLLRYEHDARLRAIYRASIERSWQIERLEQSPLFNFIYAAVRQADQWSEPARRPAAAGAATGRAPQHQWGRPCSPLLGDQPILPRLTDHHTIDRMTQAPP
jgi:hypothetical protein